MLSTILNNAKKIIKTPLEKNDEPENRKHRISNPNKKKHPPFHGFSYKILVNYANSRLVLNSLLSTDVSDLYKDYLYFIYSLSEQEKKQIGVEKISTDLNHFLLDSYNQKLNLVGLISKRNFGSLLETVIEEQNASVQRKRSKSIFIQGVGLKTAEGLLAFEQAEFMNKISTLDFD